MHTSIGTPMPYLVNLDADDGVEERADGAALTAMLERVLTEDGVPDGASLSVVLGDDVMLRELNRRHRDTDAPTDVLSFPASEGEDAPLAEDEAGYLGDIVVSVESVERQAEEAGLAADEELAHVVLHGLLHLLGYDHEEADDEAVMKAREEAVLGPTIHAGREAHGD
ncbi:MAG: rRNA maturation RNase YbeY [Dehalococcoidia bacterium]|nr:rRNA maturation RNase YbeY [Dehalococcoidia bacterium]